MTEESKTNPAQEPEDLKETPSEPEKQASENAAPETAPQESEGTEPASAEEEQPEAADAVPGSKSLEKCQKMLDKIDEMSQKYVALLGSTKEADGEERIRIMARIENSYWELLGEIAFNAVSMDSDNLDFTGHDTSLINYGINQYTEKKDELLKKLEDETSHSGEHVIMSFTEGLNVYLQNVRKVNQLKSLREHSERVNNTLSVIPKMIKDLIDKRKALLGSSLSQAEAAAVETLNGELDKILVPFTKLKMQIKSGKMDSSKKRQDFIQLSQKDKDLRAKRTEILRRYTNVEPIFSVFKEIESKFMAHIALQMEATGIAKEISDIETYIANLSFKDMQLALKEEIAKVRTLLKVCSRRARRNPSALLFNSSNIMTKNIISESIREIEDYDPKLFDNRTVKRFGKPPFILVPGVGYSIYDWMNNVILVPIMYPSNPLESLAHGIITYRDDVDSVGGYHEMRYSFHHDIKENEEIRSSRALMEKMISDYVTWITKEAKGYAVLTKETREWFELRIAPDKYGVKRPREMQNWSAVKCREFIKENSEPKEKDAIYTLAVCYGIIGEWQLAMDNFEKVIEMDKKVYDAYFNAGITAHKLHLRKAAQFFSKYITYAPQSWWSRKANEYVSQIK